MLDEAIARTAKLDPQVNAVVVKHYDFAERQIERGLPDGPFMMFSAKFGDEGTLFRLAGQLEQMRPWSNKLPPVCAQRSPQKCQGWTKLSLIRQ